MEGSKEKTLAKMDAAAKEAETKLEALLENMDSEQKEGAQKIILWFKDNYMAAGYKRLGRTLKDLP